jgi:hypothetical protein
LSNDARQALAALASKAKAFADAQRKLYPAARVLTAEPMTSSASAKEAALLRSLSSAPALAPARTAPQSAKLVFVSATPLPAESPAGKLLAKIVQAMGLAPAQTALCAPDELEAKLPELKPLALVALGAAACEALLKNGGDFGKLRGRFCEHGGLPLMPTHHPSELVENDALKRHVWEDMKLVAAKLKS